MNKLDEYERKYREALQRTTEKREAQRLPSSSVSGGTESRNDGLIYHTPAKQESYFTTVKPKSARQRLLEVNSLSDKWYSGDTPTTSEALAQIYQIAKIDKERANSLYERFNNLRNDPANKSFYDPYSQATNRNIAAIAAYGIDVSNGIDDKWFEDNAWLKNHFRYGSSDNPLGTAKKATWQQNAASIYNDLWNAEQNTKKAETEWQALQDEVKYWANRKDLNLSDEEILNRIDWSNYKELQKMDASLEEGTPISYNRAIGYNRDNLYGVLWEARNGSNSTNTASDAIRYRLGQGATYQENAEARARRDATSDYYNPYWNGIASDDMNETALYFGTDRFDQDWIDSHRYIMNGNDETAKREYQKVVAAEETTRKAEEEIKALQDRVDSYIKLGITDPEKILDGILDADDINGEPALSTLKKLDESLGDYKMMNTTRALQYSYRDLKREVERRCEEEKNKMPSYQFAKDVEKQYGAGHMVPPSQVQNDPDRTNIVHEKTSEDAVNEARDRNIQENAETIRSTGTPEEKVVYGTAASSTYNRDVGDISNTLTSVPVSGQTAADTALNSATSYANKNYAGARSTLNQWNTLQEALDAIDAQIAAVFGTEEEEKKPKASVDMSKVVGKTAAGGAQEQPMGKPGESMSVTKDEKTAIQNWLKDQPANGMVQLTERDWQFLPQETKDRYIDAARAERERYEGLDTDAQDELRKLEYQRNQIVEQMNGMEGAKAAAEDQVRQTREMFDEYLNICEMNGVEPVDIGQYYADVDLLAGIMDTYTPLEYSAMTVFEAAVQAGEMDNASLQEVAKATKADLEDKLQILQGAIDRVGESVTATNAQRNNLKWEEEGLIRTIKDCEDFLLEGNADFFKVSAAGMEKARDAWKNGYRFGSTKVADYTELDRAVADKDWVELVMSDPTEGGTKYYQTYWMTDAERARYFYYRETQGEEAARDYYERLNDDTYGVLSVRRGEFEEEGARRMAEEYPILANALKVVTSEGKAVGGIVSMYNLLTGKQVSNYSQYNKAIRTNNIVAQTSKEKIAKTFEGHPTLAKIADGAYDVMSMGLESGWNSLLMGPLVSVFSGAKAASFIGKFGLSASSALVGAAPMAAGAMGDTILDVLDRGGTPEQAAMMGGVTFFSEIVSEAISLDNIIGAFYDSKMTGASFKNLLLNSAKSFITEGSEELLSGAIDQWADDVIMDELSKRREMINDLVLNQGYDQQEAEAKVAQQLVNDILKEGLLGGLGGTFGTATSYGLGAVTNTASKLSQRSDINKQFKGGGRLVENMVKETDAKVQTAEANYSQAEEAAANARKAANDTSLTAEEQQAAAAEAGRLEQEAANAKAELETAQQEKEQATVDRNKWNALREGAIAFHEDYQAMQQAEAIAQEAKGTKNETQRRKDADKAKEKYEKSKSEFKKQYSDVAESGIAEQLGITAEDLEADPVEVANAVFEAENVTETDEESTEAPAEEVTAPNAEQATIEEKQPLTQEERDRALQKVEQLETEARQAEKEATAAFERASEARKTAQTENTEEARNAASIAQQEADQAQARAFEARKQANKAAQADAILQALEGKTPQPRQNRFGIAVNEAEAQRLTNDLTALNSTDGYDQSAATAAVAAVLADSAEGTQGSTAAQHMMEEYGADKVISGIKKILDAAVNRAGIALSDAKNAIVTAYLNNGGIAHAMLGKMLEGELTTDGLAQMVAAARQEAADPNVQASLRAQDRENRISQRAKELAGNDQSQAVAKAKEAVSSIKEKISNLRSMMNDLRTKYDNAGEYIWQLTQEYCKLSADGKQDAADSVGNQRNNAYKQRASLKDSFNKAAQEFVDAQENLKKAMEDLRAVRQQRENELRQQAIAEIDAEDAAAAQAMAEQQAAEQAAAEQQALEQEIQDRTQKLRQKLMLDTYAENGAENINQAAQDIAEAVAEAATGELENGTEGQPAAPKGPGIRAYRGNAQYNGTETNAGNSRVTVSPYQSAVNLADSLGIGHSIGTRKMNNLPKAVRGYYKTNAQYLAVRSSDAGNYRVTMHEIWHHLGQKLGMEGTQQMVQNLPQAFREGYSKAELPGEAFAEFGWRYIMGDEAARSFAGDAFTDEFEKAIRKSGDYDAIQKARNEVQGWINGTLSERLGAVIRNKSDANRQRTSLRDRIANIVDDTSAAEAMNRKIRRQTGGNIPIENDVRKNGLLRNFKTTVANNLLNKALTDSDGTVIGDSLAKRFEDAGLDGKDFDDFSKYLLVKHSMDRDANGAPVFDIDSFPNETRQEWLDQMDREHPEFRRAADALQAFRTELMQAWLVDTGIMTQDQFDRLQEKYPNYVPTFRVMDQPGGQRATGNGSTFRIRRATGGTQDIVNPMDSFVDMVGSIVTTAKNNKVAQAFDNAYHQYEGMGEFARDVTQDVEKVALDMQALQEQVNKILEGNADGDVVKQVLDAIGPEQAEWRRTGKVNLPNVITVTRTDGSKAYYQVYDTELYNLLTGMRNNDTSEAIQTVAKLNHFMSAMTTGSNPIFAVRNFMRDFQNSVNYGSWASNYITGAAKWLRAMYDVWTEGGEYGDYMALGGGGWNRINTGTKAGAEEYRSGLFKGYGTSNAERTAKTALKAAGALVTLERLNEVVEQTSRYAEYKYGKHDKSTAEGRQEAFLASQDATVDFARSGNGKLAADLKAVIPFFGASLQGVYRTGRMLTEAERSRAPARFAKTIINTALTSAIAAGLMMKYSDDDEKKDFERMSDDLKSQHFYIPNFAPEIFGDQKLLRIPLAQDPLTYAVHGMVTNALWNGTSDGMMIDIAATANTILDNLKPIGSTVFDPLISMKTNRNWYGSNIVPSYMSDWDASTQYTEETPDMFVAAGRALGVSPLKLQYLAEQYTGFIGQLAIPALSKDEHSGEIGGWKAAISAARKRLTSDPLVSNNIVSSFYDGESLLKQAKKAAENERPMNMLRRGLTQDEINAAYAEADEMLSSKGIIGTTKKAISQLYNDIDAINANPDLTDSEKYTLTTAKRREMTNLALDAQEEIGAWKEKYVTGKNLVTSILYEGEKAEKPTALTKMPAIFKEDAGMAYMQKSTSVYEATGKDSALPHPLSESGTFSDNKTEYTLSDGNYALYLDTYHTTYENGVNSIRDWNSLTDAERLERLTKVHNAARDAAKAAWLKDYKLTH